MMRAVARLSSCLPRRLARDRRGVSAVEFALVAPLMIALYLGCVDISQGVAVQRKVSLIAATLANLASSCDTGSNCVNNTISSAEMTNILDASSAIIAPYSVGPLRMSLSCVAFDANKVMTVKWTALRGETSAPTITVPSDLQQPNTQLLYAEASYTYTPIVGSPVTGTLTLSDHMFMAPRIAAPTYNDGTDHPCT